jgi:alkanesulfonate monooxygenase SsuD/methylene tetrahydromethanopterin reductase-like flavin-dependent oxidoreductase (luciferase family)
VQRPHPPFFIGGGGRTTLLLAAREAQTVGLAPRILPGGRPDPRSFTWTATEEKIGWVREAAGERFAELTLNVYPSFWPVTVTDDLEGEAKKVVAALKDGSGIELTVAEVVDSPHIFIGSLDRFVEKFTELRKRLGISSFLVGDLDQLAPVVQELAAP